MKVINVNGSSRWPAPSGYASWLDYWKAHNGSAYCCSAYDCSGTDLVGAHVRKYNSTDQRMYIVPICRSCNNRTDAFDVLADRLLPVPSNL